MAPPENHANCKNSICRGNSCSTFPVYVKHNIFYHFCTNHKASLQNEEPAVSANYKMFPLQTQEPVIAYLCKHLGYPKKLFWRTPGGPYNGVEIYRGIFITVFQRQDGAFPSLFSVWKPKNNAVFVCRVTQTHRTKHLWNERPFLVYHHVKFGNAGCFSPVLSCQQFGPALAPTIRNIKDASFPHDNLIANVFSSQET